MKPVNPQAVSRYLKEQGVNTLLWSDRFKLEGVSVFRGPFGGVMVTVEYTSRAVRDEVETRVVSLLVKAGYRVDGSGGVLRVARVEAG